jgi:glutaredoxin
MIKENTTGMKYLSLLAAILLAIASAHGLSAQEASSESQAVRMLVFYDKDCDDCEVLKETILPALRAEYGFPIEARYMEVTNTKNYAMLRDLEERYQDKGNELPVVFIGEHVLGGLEEITERLGAIVEDYVYMGGTDWPSVEGMQQTTLESDAKLYLVFFSRSGCKHCDRVQHMLTNIQSRCPSLVVKTLDSLDREDMKLQEAISEIVGIPQEKRLISPGVVIGKDYLVGDDITDASLESLVAKYLESGSSCLWEDAQKMENRAEEGIIKRFKSLGTLAVIGAGLVDGINPCAFTTIIFFIAYLAFIGRKKKEVLYTGIAFTSAVFVTYLLIGLGAFKFLRVLSGFSFLRHILYLVAACAALVFGVFSLYDYYKVRKDKIKELKLQLPKAVKNRIYKVIRERTGIGNILIAALTVGFLISVLELACTGQMYLPTITFVAGASGLRSRAILLLVIYNIMFVLPLVIVFLLSFYGTTSQKLSRIMMKHLGKTKALTSVLFFCLGILLILTWVRGL